MGTFISAVCGDVVMVWPTGCHESKNNARINLTDNSQNTPLPARSRVPVYNYASHEPFGIGCCYNNNNNL